MTILPAMGFLAFIPLGSPPADSSQFQTMLATTPGYQITVSSEEEAFLRYVPPSNAKPRGRIDGAARGTEDETPAILVLAPKDHVGLTTEEQPTLYWYLSKPATYPLTFTLTTAEAIEPLVEAELDPPGQPGIQAIDLATFGVTLEPGVTYEWFVTLVRDPEFPSKDLVAGAAVERVEFVEAQLIYLPAAEQGDPVDLAKAGLWYDALEAISGRIQSSPEKRELRRQRAALLEQVALPQVAEHDLKKIDGR